jgi:hypothetical protein
MRSVVVAVALAALGLACGGTSEPVEVVVPAEPLATLTLRWSLAGSTDPATCAESVADRIDISVIDPGTGGEIAGFQQTCEAFHTSITLVPGAYAARARLVDAADHARTTDVTVPTFTVQSNEVLVQDIDFPRDSFF